MYSLFMNTETQNFSEIALGRVCTSPINFTISVHFILLKFPQIRASELIQFWQHSQLVIIPTGSYIPYLRVRYWTVRTAYARKSSGVIKSVRIMQPHSNKQVSSSSSLLTYNDSSSAWFVIKIAHINFRYRNTSYYLHQRSCIFVLFSER